MRPRTAKTPNKAKAKGKPASTPSDDENAFESPSRADETDYGLDFTSGRLTTPRRLPSSTMNKSQKTRRQDVDSDNDDDAENQPPAMSPRRRAALQRSQSNRNPIDDDEAQKSTQKSLQQDVESSYDDDYDDEEEEEQAKQATATKQKNAKETKQRSSTGKSQPPPPQPVAKAAPRRKQRKPEHRLKKLQREIIRLQGTDAFLIPRLPFSRLVRELMAEHTLSVFKITLGALEALQTSTEMYLSQRFEDAYLLTKYRGRVTLEVRDMALVSYFCRTYGNN